MRTLVCAPIMVDDATAALADAMRAKLAGAQLVEYRIDELFQGAGDSEGEAAALRLCAETPLPCIVTCRPMWEGGQYDGDDDARIALYERLSTSDAPPAYIDVELAAYERSANLRQKVRLAVDHPGQPREGLPRLILSTHDFEGRPRDLLQRIERMQQIDACAIVKVAFRARSLRDNLECFELLATRNRPTVLLAMGEFGLASRVLAPKFGGYLTFASIANDAKTAPGQPTIAELLGLYRFQSIDPHTCVYGVIGWPVAHSLSPHAHNAVFEALGHDGVYVPMPVAEGWEPFKATLGVMTYAIESDFLGFSGASVTIPHKTNLVRFAEEHQDEGWRIDPIAAKIGAANTIARVEGKWFVTNTDAPAIVESLRDACDGTLPKRVLVLGAGGAARAAVAGLCAEGVSVSIANRTAARAHALAEEFGAHALEMDAVYTVDFDAVINTTPIGMAEGPDPKGSPIDLSQFSTPPSVVFDTVYTPRRTPLLQQATSLGLRTIEGMEMFVRQAAAQSTLWTGDIAPVGLLRRIVEESLDAKG